MKKQTVGIVAHVDAGKTTCIESMLYTSHEIKKAGRVDHHDTVMDYDAEERSHGITIYAKEAHFHWCNTDFYLIDTPGHVDFSSEMERSLSILDMAVLIINGQDGVQSHTETIWKCLEHYHIPVIVFMNKMDISYQTKENLLADMKKKCSDACIGWNQTDTDEELSLCSEEMLNEYLTNGIIENGLIQDAFYERKFFPVLYGSALKNEGVAELMNLMDSLSPVRQYPSEFGARVYKISVDADGERLTHMKITGGTLETKSRISDDEKVDQIRIYQGGTYTAVSSICSGEVAAVKGLKSYEAGSGLGFEQDAGKPLLDAYMTYELLFPKGFNALAAAETLRQCAEEDPQLDVNVDDTSKKMTVHIMGEMQKEILQKKIYDRCGIMVGFGEGKIVYQETIAQPSEGAGHFEPLRHYAEVHVRIEPLMQGSGIEVVNLIPADGLNKAWQRQIIAALEKTRHIGVLTGSQLTDVRINILAAKGSIKHTSGGDFRQASVRAVRQALMKTQSVLLEPYDAFTLTIPGASLSRALFDLETRNCEVSVKEAGDVRIITGRGPVRTLTNYQKEVTAYTKGLGRFTASLEGYHPSAAAKTIIAETGYDPDADIAHPAGSVFCANGSGYQVPWDEADVHMAIQLKQQSTSSYTSQAVHISEADLASILSSASSNNRNENKKHTAPLEEEKPKKKTVQAKLPPLLIVDGYNMIYDWPLLKETAKEDLYGARAKLMEILQNYQAFIGGRMIVVFDGYLRKDNNGTILQKKDLTVVYTRTDQTADAWIEKTCYEYRNTYALSVATSDGLIQNAVFAQGALRISAKELEGRIALTNQMIQEKIEAL